MHEKHRSQYSMLDSRTQTENDVAFADQMDAYFSASIGDNVTKLRNFAKFVPRQSLSLFLAKHELFREVLRVHGHIIECGVFLGGGGYLRGRS